MIGSHHKPPIKIGLLGCGRIAQLFHLKILARLPQVDLVAIAEPDSGIQSKARTHAPGARFYADYAELIQCPDIQAVVICLPTGTHAASATAALEQGKHIYVEKPLATSLDEARRVIDAWKISQKIAMIGFNTRFHPRIRAARQYVRDGRIGQLLHVQASFCSPGRQLPAWKQTRATGGGVLLDLASHIVDQVHFVFEQPICEVAARIWSVTNDDDNAYLELSLPNELVVQSFVSLTSTQESRMEIYGERGKLVVDRIQDHLEVQPLQLFYNLRHRLRRAARRTMLLPGQVWKEAMPPVEPSYETALRSFVGAIISGGDVAVDLIDGYRSLAVVQAAEESARTGRTVPMKSVQDYVHADS